MGGGGGEGWISSRGTVWWGQANTRKMKTSSVTPAQCSQSAWHFTQCAQSFHFAQPSHTFTYTILIRIPRASNWIFSHLQLIYQFVCGEPMGSLYTGKVEYITFVACWAWGPCESSQTSVTLVSYTSLRTCHKKIVSYSLAIQEYWICYLVKIVISGCTFAWENTCELNKNV
jgi:hypothetical protein